MVEAAAHAAGEAAAATDGETPSLVAAAEGEASPMVSEWIGGSGGYECPLSCAEGGGGYRSGGLVEGLVANGGGRVDRIEMHRCTGDLEV